nr:hypothetical protein [Ruegeria marina]
MERLELGQPGKQPLFQEIGIPEQPDLVWCGNVHLAQTGFDLRECGSGQIRHTLPERRDFDPPVISTEQSLPKLDFKRRNLFAYSRLGHTQGISRQGKAVIPRDGDENPQAIQIGKAICREFFEFYAGFIRI